MDAAPSPRRPASLAETAPLVSPPTHVDELYAAFVDTLPEGLRDVARAFPVILGLAPTPDVPWSEVFSNEITLAAPTLVAAAMPTISAEVTRQAGLAHLLAIIDAFGTDRLLDGQIDPAPEIDAVLTLVRRARDAALAGVLALAPEGGRDGEHDGEDDELSYARAEAETAAAIRAEHAILRSGEAVTWSRYLSLAHAKQRLGLPASLALARVAGWDARRRRALARLLDAVCVGLQLHDDVVDWEDDLSRGGAWAASLAAQASLHVDAHDRRTIPVSARRLVQASGALLRMLEQATRSFRAARRRAGVLGMERVAAWARERELTVGELARQEAVSPGHTNRARALSIWAKTVLSE